MADLGSMLRLSGPNMLDGNPLNRSQFQQLASDIFRAIIDLNGARLAAPFDNAIKAPVDPFGGQGKIDLDAQPFAVEIPYGV